MNTYFKHDVGYVVTTINNAYTAKSLRKPILQATILEYVHPDVKKVTIPKAIIERFSSSITSNRSRYFEASGDAKNNVTYLHANIVRGTASPYNNPLYKDCPTLDKPEALMWLFQQAQFYIDNGFTALHVGQMHWIAGFDYGYPGNNQLIAQLASEIRSYAAFKSTFVLLSSEGVRIKPYTLNGQEIFDFNSSALRPIGVNYQATTLSGTCSANGADAITGQLNTVASTSTNTLYSPLLLGYGSGTSPMGCQFDNYPTSVYFDFGSGRNCSDINNITPTEEYFAWGKDDARWFSERSDCFQVAWLQKNMCELKNLDNGMLFLQAPVKLIVKANGDCESTNDSNYYLADHSDVRTAIRNTWAAKVPTLEYTSPICNPYTSYTSPYNFYAGNTDCTSIYSWHIKRPDGSWESETYGSSRSYLPPYSGMYTIYLRQDNFGLNNSLYPFGEKTITQDIYLTVCPDPYHQLGNLRSTNPLDKEPFVFPNPTNDEININYSLSKPSRVSISVFNTTGSKVITLKEEQNIETIGDANEKFSVSTLSPGVYIITLNIDNEVQKLRFVKM